MSTGFDRTHDNSYDNFVKNRYNENNYLYNQYQQPNSRAPEDKDSNVGDYTTFYIVVTICTLFICTLFILNIVLGCCSKYSKYWNDKYTGNRYIMSLWTGTPHKQPPLDNLTELQEISSQQQVVYHHPQEEEKTGFLELKKRESEI